MQLIHLTHTTGHPSMLGSFVTPREHGIRHGIVHSTLMRLAGADITIFPNFGGRFSYSLEECMEIASYAREPLGKLKPAWISPAGGMSIDRLADIASEIKARLRYVRRDEPGIQDPVETLAKGSGSCRDFAWLMMVALRQQDWPARFVTGYLTSSAHPDASGATHAWLEVYLNDLGWVGVDPTCGDLVRGKHIAVATSQRPDQLPPVAGSFMGPSQTRSTLEVSVSAQFVDS
ncbi:MAG: hypothetical protein EBY55_04625 [Gammaproteobacteria bacterium]|nr:hypothetical protein [Gammaproteobacteria bacterium]